jgi:F-type H+-transporting ATPase subunit b
VTTKDLSTGSPTDSDATQTQVGQDGAAHSNFPPFDAGTFPSQLVWFAIAFGFLYWYLSKRGLPQLGAVIEGRKARIAGDLDEATAMQQKADAAAAAHEKTLAEARATLRGRSLSASEDVGPIHRRSQPL